MTNAIEDVTREALNLPLHQRLALTGFLLESAEAAPDPEAEAGWESEIRDRIQAIDAGQVAIAQSARKPLIWTEPAKLIHELIRNADWCPPPLANFSRRGDGEAVNWLV